MDDGGFFPKTNFHGGTKLFCGNFMGSTCRAYDHIVPREEGGGGGGGGEGLQMHFPVI